MKYEFVEVNKHFELQKGISYTSKELVENSETGLLTINAFNAGGGFKLDSEKPFGGELKPNYLLSDGDVLLAMTEQDAGLLASPLTIKSDYSKYSNLVFSLDVARVLSTSSQIDPNFLYNVLRIPAFRVRAAYGDTGSTVQRLPYEAFGELKIPSPPMNVQRAIVKIIDEIDSKIHLNKGTAETLEQIAQAIFKSWFIDFDPVHAKSRGEEPEGMDAETAALFPASFQESELGLIPTGWSYARADSLFHITIGRTPPRKEAEWFCDGKSGIPWISIRDMGTFGVFSGATNEGLTPEAVAKFRVPIVPEDSVLFSFKLTVGKVCITDTEVLTNEAIAHFRSKRADGPSAKYAYLWLKFFDSASLDSTSSIATATNSSHIKALSFLVPTVELLKAFDSATGPLFEAIRTLTRQNRTLVEIRDALLPRLISGELEIPEELLVD